MNSCNITHVTLSSKPPINHCMTASFYYEGRFMSIEIVYPCPAILCWSACTKPGKWAVMYIYVWARSIDFAYETFVIEVPASSAYQTRLKMFLIRKVWRSTKRSIGSRKSTKDR